jgi:dATP pyrophosphohydrolase
VTNRIPFSVHVFLAARRDAAWSVLLLRRNARPDLALPDFWQGVSGALELGESFEDAARREVLEETAIEISSMRETGFERDFPIKVEWRTAYGPGPKVVRERIFYAVLPATVDPVLSHEHKEFRWCASAEALDLLTFEGIRECALAVFAALQTGRS